MKTAVVTRKLWFIAGPESTWFCACEDHKRQLEGRGAVDCFFARERDPIRPLDDGTEEECYFCRGEEGP